jgi:hypothetical protein
LNNAAGDATRLGQGLAQEMKDVAADTANYQA